jgi:hypothetical protein
MPDAASDVHATDLALPVMGFERSESSWSNKPREICGTAFTIGGGAYLTAAHVWERARTHDMQALGIMHEPETGVFKFHRITDGEGLASLDLAVLRAAVSFGKTFQWSAARVALLDGVRSYGYPFGFDPKTEMLNVRAFRGEIVGGGTLDRLPARPAGLEISFACPRGLSGAPLIRTDPEPQRIIGVVIGNEITEMTVYREEEKLAEGKHEKTLIKTEALHLGIAIRADAVLAATSSLLRCTIGEWLGRYRLRE